MSCNVCMENDDNCHLVCGHSFCHPCVKEWYTKGNSTCPMCRNPICFRGFVKTVKKWQEEKNEQKLQDIFTECLENILEDYESDTEYESETESEVWSEDDGAFDDPEETLEEEEIQMPEFSMTEIMSFFPRCTKMNQIENMQKKFNKYKEILSYDELQEICDTDMYDIALETDHFLYEDPPVKETPMHISRSTRALSQKRFRKKAQTQGDALDVIQVLLGQLALVY